MISPAPAARMSRRSWLGRVIALAAVALAAPRSNAPAAPLRGDPRAFTIAGLRKRAAQLAERPFQAPRETLSDTLRDLSYDEYRDIRFRAQEALWLGEAPFTAQFFHPGFYYRTPVRIFEVLGENAYEIQYAPALFDFGGNRFGSAAVDQVAGFAGFRFHYALNDANYLDELIAFLGASYFRALGRGMHYGLSARGLALATASEQGEEFPFFAEFYLERPVDANSLVIHALLNSESVTGAYTFTVRPGDDTVVDVNLTLYPRQAIELVGIAPLTSMFFFAGNDRVGIDDYRPECHDSDGLLIRNGAGEWLWRPLVNPLRVRISSFLDHNPKGFGLMQRARRFEDYQDTEAHYESRPSAWVEPVGDWGAGSVMLFEIPTNLEINDNIVAFWRPQSPLAAGVEWQATYRLHWCLDVPVAGSPPGRVQATRVGAGSVAGTRKFVIDFGGDALPASEGGVHAIVTTSHGTVSNVVTHPKGPGQWRAFFELSPDGNEPIELRCFLAVEKTPISETWSYQWTE